MGKGKRSRGSFSIAINTPQAAKLRDVVHQKLSEFMGDYPDMVLAEYVVVLVCNGKHQLQAMEDLDAFLGDESGPFVAWLWDHLAANTHIYKASSQMLRSIEGTALDEKEKSNYEKQTKEWSKEKLRTTHDKPKQNAHTKLMIKHSLVSTMSHEDSKAKLPKHIEVIETLQRGCMGDNSFSVERRKIQRLKPSQYAHVNFREDENDQHADLKCSSHLKRQHTADFSSYRDHSVQHGKFANKRIVSSPCTVAPHHLLQSAVREVVSPSGLTSSKYSESEIKNLHSVVVENPDAARDTVAVPHISNPHRSPVPATNIAMCVADVAYENDIARVRPTRSVWDRLGNPFSEEVNGFEQEMDEHIKGFAKKQEIESIFLDQDDINCEHGGWFDVHSLPGRGLLNRLYKNFTEDRAMIEDKNIKPVTNGEGYRELWEDVSKINMHANATSSMGNRQQGYKRARHPPTELINKDHEEPVTLEYKLSQTLNKSTSESRKHNTSSFRAADTSQKVVNISVNVNTWKQAHLESVKGTVDEEAVVSSTTQQKLQDQNEMSVDDVLADINEMGLLKESEQLTHTFEKNDVASIRSRLCKVELEMANLRAKQAKFCKDVPNAGTATSGIQSLLLDSEDNLDSRTVFVNNVHFAATKEALSSHFNQCGEVLKVIVLTDVTNGQPKGYIYDGPL
ncbi:uncharacterized protein LOC131061992 isoform X2 [Cryptomeria japonica]|uniref:uncharacterized protein LOC131061992 isoform X2 n=1 Tax=Cryptomeria japonica TaxID=3369 RepID=UPI0025AD1829|nr:uncharacterized protein LOC131061992 isoform X2 [Cryptomeria japonica]